MQAANSKKANEDSRNRRRQTTRKLVFRASVANGKEASGLRREPFHIFVHLEYGRIGRALYWLQPMILRHAALSVFRRCRPSEQFCS